MLHTNTQKKLKVRGLRRYAKHKQTYGHSDERTNGRTKKSQEVPSRLKTDVTF